MNKIHLLHEAENLYSVENLTPEMIAEKLNISRRTVFNWKKKYKWDNHIVKTKDFSNQFADDIYNIGTKLLAKLNDDIKSFYVECKNRNLCAKRIKNTLALLNQLLKYYQNRGIISKKCVFQVKRLTNENKFDESRIVFE